MRYLLRMVSHFSSVAIIGGGLSGPILALSLQSLGIKATIYESRPRDYPQPGTIVLIPNSLRILDRLGLLSTIKGGAFAFTLFNVVKKDGSMIGRMIMGSEERYGYPALRVYRDKLRHALLDAAKKSGVEVKYGMRCTGIEIETSSQAIATFEDGEKVQADLIVGADGVNSKIRPHIHPGVASEYTGGMFITGSLDRKDLGPFKWPLPCVIPGPAGKFALAPADKEGEVISFFAWINGQEKAREEWRELGKNKAELRKIIQSYNSDAYPDVVRALVTETPLYILNCWPFQIVPKLETYVSETGRVVIMGDAAHASKPNGGQGGSVSLEDAATLAIAIKKAYTKTDFSEAREILTRWDSSRVQRIEQVVKAPVGMGMQMGPEDPFLKEGRKKEHDQLYWLYGYDANDIEQSL
ncbi:FAD/NAD(P)-binding domain-containing protein [Stipitochalara longipes BDJ]|nr:FAD/NAD(P)-binding domain-containing protein [Stipitochalara longipes BDJ]